ncbi:MAG: EAL domain-containing protein [Gammaproteobacteria bacterium]|nr:EAL domain-containing protein [Gammaproteobacteria bacterium]
MEELTVVVLFRRFLATVIGLLIVATVVLGVLTIVIARQQAVTRATDIAETIRAMVMSTRRVYQSAILDSGVPLNERTISLLPAHAMSRISDDFRHWSDTGIVFNTVSDRFRNPANAADEADSRAIAHFQANPDATHRMEREPGPNGDAIYRYVSPLRIETPCLACHGRRDDAPAAIKARYDEGYGYELGDVRGVLSIRIPARLVETWVSPTAGIFWLLSAGGVILVALALIVGVHRAFIRRIAGLVVMSRRFREGDYSARAVATGDDELAELTASMNDMATAFEGRERQLIAERQAYAVSSAVNQSIVQAGSRTDLFNRLCDIALGFARIGMAAVAAGAERDPLRWQVAGMTDLIDDWHSSPATRPPISGTLDESSRGEDITVYRLDAVDAPWARAAQARGFVEMAAVELSDRGEARAVFMLWSNAPDSFSPAMRALLAQIRVDVAYALRVHHREELLANTEKRLDFTMTHDAVTGLINRDGLLTRLRQAMWDVDRDDKCGALLLVSLLELGELQGGAGGEVVEKLLQEIATRLQAAMPPKATIAHGRLNEFMLLLPELRGGRDAAVVTANVIAAQVQWIVGIGFPLKHGTHHLASAVGVEIFSRARGVSPEEVLNRASAALAVAKRDGTEAIRVYEPAFEEVVSQRLRLRDELKRALEQHEFELWFQPKVRLSDAHPVGVEALLRWRHPERGLLAPGAFIDELERTGLVRDVGWWVLTEASRRIAKWRTQGWWRAPMRCAVNLSALQLAALDCTDRLRAADDAYPTVSPSDIELEITESSLVAPELGIAARLDELRALGYSIAIDDFGTGYSSLAYLRRLPADVLKIDMSFVREVAIQPDALAVVQTILAFANEFGMRTVAEGIEHLAQHQVLCDLGADIGQGYLYARPMDGDAFETWMHARLHRETLQLLTRVARQPGEGGFPEEARISNQEPSAEV